MQNPTRALCATETTARDPFSQSSALSASGERRWLASASSLRSARCAHSRAALLWPRARASWANCCACRCLARLSSAERSGRMRFDAGKGSCRICRVSFASERAQCSKHKPANSCRYLRSDDLGMLVDGVNALTHAGRQDWMACQDVVERLTDLGFFLGRAWRAGDRMLRGGHVGNLTRESLKNRLKRVKKVAWRLRPACDLSKLVGARNAALRAQPQPQPRPASVFRRRNSTRLTMTVDTLSISSLRNSQTPLLRVHQAPRRLPQQQQQRPRGLRSLCGSL